MPDRRFKVSMVERPVDHVACVAWRRLGLTRVDPTRIDVLEESWKTDAYRLHGCGPGGVDIVATRRPTETTLVERTIYDDVLTLAQVPALRLHGVLDEGHGKTWMFLDDAGDDMVDLRRHADRVLAGRWLGRLHAELVGVSFADRLPDRGAADAIATVRSSRVALANIRVDPQLDQAGGQLVDDVVGRLDAIESSWGRIERMVAGVPTTLVHADYVHKNLRHRPTAGWPGIVPFDWEMSGWGVPLRDLGLVDIGAYLDEARAFWGRHAISLDRLADVGRLFMLVAAIGWEVPIPGTRWSTRFLRRLPMFHGRLGSVLVRLDLVGGGRRAAVAAPGDRDWDGAAVADGLTTMESRSGSRIVDVIEIEPNVYSSTYPSAIARCAFDDRVERRVFVKRYIPGRHGGGPFWDGGPYEARMYDDVLAAHDLGTPMYLGSWSDPRTGDTFLALEYVEGWRLSRSDPRWLIEAARWLGRLHRDATPTAARQPAMRRYDAAFFEGRSRQALASVRAAYRDASWMARLVRRFDDVLVPRLLGAEPVFIHGEPYPQNVIVSYGRVRTVDWQSAAIGPAAVDLACLTEGPWPVEDVAAAVSAYERERWPAGAPADFRDQLEAARLYWSMRWLGANADARTASLHVDYVARLRESAERLGVVPAGS